MDDNTKNPSAKQPRTDRQVEGAVAAPLPASGAPSTLAPATTEIAEAVQEPSAIQIGKIPPEQLLDRLAKAWEFHENQKTARLTLLVLHVLRPLTWGLVGLAALLIGVAVYALAIGQGEFARELLTHTVALAAGLAVGALVRTRSEE